MVKPYNKENSKKNEVRAMFNSIARSYDLLNHTLSLGVDIIWRKKLIRELKKSEPGLVLDMATGTGDLAIMAARKLNCNVTGIDLSSEMIAVGNKKIEQRQLTDQIKLKLGDAENIDESDNLFDAAMVAFGVRNFENLSKGLLEMNRVIKPGKNIFILEFSTPVKFPFKQFYNFYNFKLLPVIGRIVSKDPRAYTYLPESIKAFPSGKAFLDILGDCNFKNCREIPLGGRIATIYIGTKNED